MMPCSPEVVREAEALVHLIRDLSADVDEVETAVRKASRMVREIAWALMREPKEAH